MKQKKKPNRRVKEEENRGGSKLYWVGLRFAGPRVLGSRFVIYFFFPV